MPQEDAESAPTLLGSNISFEGKLKGKDSICIQGNFNGIVESGGSVYVNKKAKVKADIVAQNVFVHGEVIGNITAGEHLNIGSSGRIRGDVETRALTVITGGFLEGACKMKTKNDTVELDKKTFDQYKVDATEESVESSEEETDSDYEEYRDDEAPATTGNKADLDLLESISPDEDQKGNDIKP